MSLQLAYMGKTPTFGRVPMYGYQALISQKFLQKAIFQGILAGGGPQEFRKTHFKFSSLISMEQIFVSIDFFGYKLL